MSYYPSYTTLKCLEASARLLNFTRAGRELHLTQGAVSHHISKLEAQLGVELFERQAGGLILTEAGIWYLQQIAPALRQIEFATDSLRGRVYRQESLRISVQPTFADYWLMPKLNQFSLDHPDIRLDIVVQSGASDANDTVDAWFEQSAGASPGIEAVKVLELSYRPYVAPARLAALGHAFADGEIAPEVVIDVLRRSPLLKTTAAYVWEHWLRQKGLMGCIDASHLEDGPTYAMVSLVLKAVMDGVGVALLPGYLVEAPVTNGQLICLDREAWHSDRPYHMRWLTARRSVVLDTLISWVRCELAEESSGIDE